MGKDREPRATGAGRTITSRYRARDSGRAVVGLDMLDRRQRQNRQVLAFRDQLLAEAGAGATPKELALIEAAAFLLLRQLRANDQLLEQGSETDRATDAALRSAGTISRLLEDLKTHQQLREAKQDRERTVKVLIGTEGPTEATEAATEGQGEPEGSPDILVRVVSVKPPPRPDAPPCGSWEQDVALARAKVAQPDEPRETPEAARTHELAVWTALVDDTPAAVPPAPLAPSGAAPQCSPPQLRDGGLGQDPGSGRQPAAALMCR